jgi:hypothetical protein
MYPNFYFVAHCFLTCFSSQRLALTPLATVVQSCMWGVVSNRETDLSSASNSTRDLVGSQGFIIFTCRRFGVHFLPPLLRHRRRNGAWPCGGRQGHGGRRWEATAAVLVVACRRGGWRGAGGGRSVLEQRTKGKCGHRGRRIVGIALCCAYGECSSLVIVLFLYDVTSFLKLAS